MRNLSHRRWALLSLALLTAFELHLLLFSYSQLASEIRTEMGLPHAQANLLFSASILALILLRVPWGLLSDRVGISAAFKLATGLMGVFGLLRGLAVNYETLFVTQLLLGVGLAAVLPCLSKLVEGWFRGEAGLATGVYVAGFPLGEMAALSLTPWVLGAVHGWRGVFTLYGAFGLLISALWWALAKEPQMRTVWGEARGVASGAPNRVEFSRLFRVREVWVLTGLCVCAMGCYDTLVASLPEVLRHGGIPPETAGLMASMLPLGFLLAGPTVGTLSDRLGLRRPFLWVLGLVGGPAIVAIVLLSDLPQWLATFAAGFCTTGVITLILVIPAEHPELSRLVGSSVGLISSLGNIGPFLFPIAVGYLKDTTGSFLPAMAMLAVIAEITLILGLVMRETGRRRS